MARIAALQDQLDEVLADVNNLTKSLMVLDAQLLDRLSSNEGNLLDDVELLGVLSNTKTKAIEVKTKLVQATQTKIDINEKRETFRPVATRGSVLYFSIVETSHLNVMYQHLCLVFELFMDSMDKSEKAPLRRNVKTCLHNDLPLITLTGVYTSRQVDFRVDRNTENLVTED